MTKRTVRAVILIAAVVCGHAAARPERPSQSDYDEMVRNTDWVWSEERGNVLYSLAQASSPYDVVLVRRHDRPLNLQFKIMRNDREVYSWWGHVYTVFALKDDRLFYVQFAVESPGGKVVAVDLAAGKVLWTSPLRAVGDAPHSAYYNQVNITANLRVVSVFGNESNGRYYELLDAQTGKTIGHKIFKEPEQRR